MPRLIAPSHLTLQAPQAALAHARANALSHERKHERKRPILLDSTNY